MQKVTDVIGKPIVSAESGERIGKVSDVLVDAETRHALALVVSGGLLTSEHVLPIGDVQTLGKDAVIVRSGAGVVGPKEWHERATDARRVSMLKGRHVLTTAGRALGEIYDVLLDDVGTVDAFEITSGGLMRKRSILPRDVGITVGADAVIVPEKRATVVDGSSGSADRRDE